MSRKTTLPPRWAALARVLGGVQNLADVCGVSTMTIWRWARGARPNPLVQKAVSRMARRAMLEDPWKESNT